MNKTDDSQTPDATRFINQRKIILKALFKFKKKDFALEENQSQHTRK